MAKDDELMALLRVVGNSNKHQKRKVLGDFEGKKIGQKLKKSRL